MGIVVFLLLAERWWREWNARHPRKLDSLELSPSSHVSSSCTSIDRFRATASARDKKEAQGTVAALLLPQLLGTSPPPHPTPPHPFLFCFPFPTPHSMIVSLKQKKQVCVRSRCYAAAAAVVQTRSSQLPPLTGATAGHWTAPIQLRIAQGTPTMRIEQEEEEEEAWEAKEGVSEVHFSRCKGTRLKWPVQPLRQEAMASRIWLHPGCTTTDLILPT
ncbi:hypothetical protein TSMEX_006758 [Taenia solium]|eukprot:TsM_000104700 transcript=TsM_000104700 gene=TsM_000104700